MPKTTCIIETLQADSPFKVLQKCKFENHVTRNDVIMMSLPKTMEDNGKMRTSAEPKKIYIVRKVLMRAIQRCNFIEFEPLCQNLRAFMSNLPKPLTRYGHDVTLVSNSENFYFLPNSILNFRKN